MQLAHHQGAARTKSFALRGLNLLGTFQQFGGGKLLQDRCAGIHGRAHRGETGNGGAVGTNPPDAHSAPKRLRHGTDSDHQLGTGHQCGHWRGCVVLVPNAYE
ncbi:Uncharacterised protein [Mycobacteroides abscessus subsp. abscessus]|nr:Uncharacterised protein [Mycobacteroides abscessus subsp. abscessus]